MDQFDKAINFAVIDYCKIDVVSENVTHGPCLNNGTCTSFVDTYNSSYLNYSCACTPQWMGRNCSIWGELCSQRIIVSSRSVRQCHLLE